MSLPEPRPAEGAVFMTRDTPAQFFEDYTITAEGKLIHHGTEEVPEDERSHRDHPSIFANSVGAWRLAPDRDEEVPFNGDLTFTDLISVSGPTYVACFIDGRCVRILLEDQHKRLMQAGRRLIHSHNVFEQLMQDCRHSVRVEKPFAVTKPDEVYASLYNGGEPVSVEDMSFGYVRVRRTPEEQAEFNKKFEK
jgi:hypothetical protein